MCEKGEKTVTVSKGRDASCLCAGVRQEQGMRVKRSLIVWRRGTCVGRPVFENCSWQSCVKVMRDALT